MSEKNQEEKNNRNMGPDSEAEKASPENLENKQAEEKPSSAGNTKQNRYEWSSTGSPDSQDIPQDEKPPLESASLDEFPDTEDLSGSSSSENPEPPNPYDQDLPPEDTEPPEDLEWKPIYAGEDSDTPPDKPKKKKKRRGYRVLVTVLVLLICILVVAIGAIAGGCYYVLKAGGAFEESTFFANTYMNGIDCSGMTVDEVYDAITEDMDSYTLTIIERDGEEVITGSDIDLAERPDLDAIQEVLDTQNSVSKLVLVTQYFSSSETEIELIRSYDEEKAAACIDALTCLDTSQMVAPVDSELVKGEDGYYITESVLGNTLDVEETRAIIESALENFEETVDLEGLGLYSSPAVTETDESLTSQLAQIETYTSASITYDFSDRTYTCDGSVIIDFLIQDEDGNWTLDEDLVHAWVDTMADETDTYQDHTFVTTSGETVELPNGNYGWKLYRDTTTEDLIEYITSGTVITTEPNYYKSNAKTRATNDIGDDYVEVDLTNQKVYLYVDGECILETDCVSGTYGNEERETPSWGVWALSYKTTDATLGDLEEDGYETEVSFWMPFNGGVGLHDATWRSSFGGSIYKTNGSHGCINLPYEAAETIYNNISAGWPIIVYGE